MKKIFPIIIATLLITVSALTLIPSTREMINSWLGAGNGHSDEGSEGFTAFIPYTLGYFPEDFDIDQAGSDNLVDEEHALYWEWYTSATHFIILVESKPARHSYYRGEGWVFDGKNATLIENPDLAYLTGEVIDFELFDISESYQIILNIEGIQLEVITNLPKEDALKVAEALIPTVCLNKPTGTPGE